MGRSNALVVGISELGDVIFKLIKAKNFSEMIINRNQIKSVFFQAVEINLNVCIGT